MKQKEKPPPTGKKYLHKWAQRVKDYHVWNEVETEGLYVKSNIKN